MYVNKRKTFLNTNNFQLGIQYMIVIKSGRFNISEIVALVLNLLISLSYYLNVYFFNTLKNDHGGSVKRLVPLIQSLAFHLESSLFMYHGGTGQTSEWIYSTKQSP